MAYNYNNVYVDIGRAHAGVCVWRRREYNYYYSVIVDSTRPTIVNS